MKLSDLVKHISYSSLNTARMDIAYWVARYGHKISDPNNAAMSRGHAVEHGLKYLHNGGEFDDPVEEALKDFNKRTALGVDGESREREAGNIPGYFENYADLWDGDLPEIESYQKKITLEIPGVDVPLIGYTDFEFEDAIVDIKTTTRMPSAITGMHRWQGAVYQKAAGNRRVEFIYLTPKKAARYVLEDSEKDWNAVCQSALRLQNFLAAFDDLDALTAAVIPNYDSFYWSHPNTRQGGQELFGF
tara:strand:+ start:517 stop:1254 length:738 start_codon:yes stop_codon:yes gene_type:complete